MGRKAKAAVTMLTSACVYVRSGGMGGWGGEKTIEAFALCWSWVMMSAVSQSSQRRKTSAPWNGGGRGCRACRMVVRGDRHVRLTVLQVSVIGQETVRGGQCDIHVHRVENRRETQRFSCKEMPLSLAFTGQSADLRWGYGDRLQLSTSAITPSGSCWDQL